MKTLSKHMKWTLAVLGMAAIAAASNPNTKHDVLILQGQQFYWTMSGGTKTQYQWGGISMYNAASSANAPHYTLPVTDYPQYYSTNNMAQVIADALDQGFTIKSIIGESWNQTVTLVREQ